MDKYLLGKWKMNITNILQCYAYKIISTYFLLKTLKPINSKSMMKHYRAICCFVCLLIHMCEISLWIFWTFNFNILAD